MGEHDTVHDKDAHGDIHDDGRTLHPMDVGARVFQGAGGGANDPLYNNPDPYLDPEIYKHTQVFRFFHGTLSPDSVLVHVRPFSVTEWESLYSSVFTLGGSNFSRASFTPIIDDSLRVVGHVGWADGNDILVPEDTVRNDRHFWSILQQVRLGEERQQILDVFDRGRGTMPNFGFPPPATSSPAPKDGNRWRGPENCVPRPHPSYRPTLLEQARSGPLPEGEIDQYLRNLDKFVNGGGQAFVGRHFLKPGFASYLDLHPSGRSIGGVGEPRKPFSSAYEFLVLVDPDGNLQGVMDIRKNLKTQVEWDFEVFLGAVDIAMTFLMVIDIAPIAVLLFRLAGKMATRATIWAIKLVVNREAKALLRLAEQEAKRVLIRGAMSGPERAEAETALQKLKQDFWEAGKVRPSRQFSKDQEKELNSKIAKRMSELGIPKKNQGAGLRHLPPAGEKPPPGGSKMRPFADENGKAFNPTGSTRGGNFRSGKFEPQYGGNEMGISVHGNLFDNWKGFDLWNHPSTTIDDRIDAIIAHEWSEFNGLTHWETVELMPETKLAISPRARELSRYMMMMGEPEMVLTEFTKAEWNAIKAAGKQNASFKEKIAAAAAAKAK
jgi:hypothetical protein